MQTHEDLPMNSRRWVKRILIAALALVFTGLIYERVEEWKDHRRFPQIGRSIDIGGRSLNIFCSGKGSPTVIMESGHALPGYEWAAVQPEIAKLTKACWYDRAGFGWSDRADSLNTVDSMPRDLHRLLRAAQIRPPYILVGHSLGGWNVRVFNGLYPGEVAGIVLVDAPSEDTLDRIPNLARRKFPISLPRHALSLVVEGMGQTGVFRLAGFSSGPHPSGFTQEQWAILSALQRNPRAIGAEINEQGAGLQSVARVRASGGLGEMPFVVLTAGLGPDVEEQRVMIQLQREFAHRFPHGNQVLVPNSDHMIPYNAPQTIVDATRSILAEIQASSK
jgi:pimeloyl-ACP methyl ester carboxylesterase